MIAPVRDFRGTVRLNGTDVYVDVRTAGDGDGPPLLLCNGIGANLELLEPVADALAEREDRPVSTIRFDVPGTGGSPTTVLPRRMRAIARMLRELIDVLGYDVVDVLGISWGGALAQEFAYRYPRRCRRVVLCATSMGMAMIPAKPSVLLTLASPLRYFRPSAMRETGARIYGGGFGSDPQLVTRFAKATRVPDPIGYYWQIVAATGWTSAHYLPRLRQPVLVIAGDDDPIIPLANARLMSWLLRDGTLHVVEGGGHLALLTHADELMPVVHEFLTR